MINRGSEWRRWELHLHTPSTKKSDQYSGSNETEKWNDFYSAISKYVGNGSFNPNIADCLESRFFSHLKFEYNNSSYGATHAELIRLGKDFLGDRMIADDIAYCEGLNQQHGEQYINLQI